MKKCLRRRGAEDPQTIKIKAICISHAGKLYKNITPRILTFIYILHCSLTFKKWGLWCRRDTCLMVSSGREDSNQTIRKFQHWVDMILTKSFNGESHQHHSFVDAIRSLSCIQLGRKLGLFVFVGWQRHRSDNNICISLTLCSTERSHNNQKWRFFHRRQWGLFGKNSCRLQRNTEGKKRIWSLLTN